MRESHGGGGGEEWRGGTEREREREGPQDRSCSVFCNPILEVSRPHFCHTLSFTQTSLAPGGRDNTGCEHQEVGHGGHLGGQLPQPLPHRSVWSQKRGTGEECNPELKRS